MINGIVNDEFEAIITLKISSNNGRVYEQSAIIDTGFNGWLSLPPDIINQLGLPWKRRGRAILGDGSECIFDVYQASIIWDDKLLIIPIDEAESEPLFGMSLMKGYKLTVEVMAVGLVTIEEL